MQTKLLNLLLYPKKSGNCIHSKEAYEAPNLDIACINHIEAFYLYFISFSNRREEYMKLDGGNAHIFKTEMVQNENQVA